ncbi:class I SAM-dependent methyltransferase [Sulfurimonas sp.]|uniref:class I SAM-dependent methyltransferase n=1 Tax=Sulfurimonas sp. TaxID=2022749 RepID=UPI002AB2F130|nr:class I SAM-dependent methyltransferase [Sulfurimonas sp.]
MKKCKLCNCDTTIICDVNTNKDYYRCLECDYIFVDEKYYLDAQSQKKHYDNHDNNLESLGYVEMFEKLIEEFITPDAKDINTALDFGCGEGAVLPILLERNNIKCDRYDLFYFPEKVYKNKKYDLICSTEVLEHLANPLDIIKELLLHLNKNGYLLFMTYFHPSDDEKFLKWFYIKDITHIGFFSKKTFEFIAAEFNLKMVRANDKNTIIFKIN